MQEVKLAYKERMMNLSNFVMVKFLQDRMVLPSESEVCHLKRLIVIPNHQILHFLAVVWVL